MSYFVLKYCVAYYSKYATTRRLTIICFILRLDRETLFSSILFGGNKIIFFLKRQLQQCISIVGVGGG